MIPRLRRPAFFSALLLLLVALVFPAARRASMQTTAPSCTQVPSGIVSWYPADENAAEEAAVDIVSHNDGTLRNGATFAPGKVGTAFSLDGVDDFIEVPDANSLDLNTLTIDAWINRTSSADARIVDKITAGGADGYALDILGNHLRLIIGGAQITGSTPIATGAYVHVAGTFDGTALRVYVNGQLDGTNTLDAAATTPANEVPLHIGVDSTTSGNLFAGQIDEVELFNRALSQPEIQSLFDADSAGKCRGPLGAQLIISEFRFRGPGIPAQQGVAASQGDKRKPAVATDPNGYDEFIELYNNSESDIHVSTTDGSAGWALAAEKNLVSTNRIMVVIPNGTVIPARTRYLVANSDGYSLGNYPAGPATTATPDKSYSAFDIPNDGGVALFKTANANLFSFETRLDAAGFAPPGEVVLRAGGGKLQPAAIDPLYREGVGLQNPVTTSVEHSFVRLLVTGKPQDTDDNASDFQLVAPNPTGLAGAVLGAPGPENSTSPHRGLIKPALLDPCTDSLSAPNRSRDGADTSAAQFGSLTLRRRFTNTSDQPVTRLRFRVVDITTTPAPDAETADVRALSSSTGPIDVTGAGCAGTAQVTVQGLTLEQPPAQPNGGGLNSTLSAGTITLASPLAAGDSIPVQFRLGIEQTGSFRFFVIIEESSDAGPIVAATTGAKRKPVVGADSKAGVTTTMKARGGAKSQSTPRIRN